MLNVWEISSGAPFDLMLDCTGPLLSEELERIVESVWQTERENRGNALHNGSIMSAVAVTPTGIQGCMVGYRLLIAQRARPELFSELRIRPVAVSGLLQCSGGVVFGRRGKSTTQDAGFWELVPSGGIDPNNTQPGTVIDYRAQILKELREETGIAATIGSVVRPFCVVEDTESHVLDIGIFMDTTLEPTQVLQIYRQDASSEYEDLLIVPEAGIDDFVAKAAPGVVGVSLALLRHSRRVNLI